jgi:hypothetical protein
LKKKYQVRIKTYQQGGRSMASPRAALTIKGSIEEELLKQGKKY